MTAREEIQVAWISLGGKKANEEENVQKIDGIYSLSCGHLQAALTAAVCARLQELRTMNLTTEQSSKMSRWREKGKERQNGESHRPDQP